MFLVLSKEKIQTYIVSVLTVAVLIGVANIGTSKIINTSNQEEVTSIENEEKEDEEEILENKIQEN